MNILFPILIFKLVIFLNFIQSSSQAGKVADLDLEEPETSGANIGPYFLKPAFPFPGDLLKIPSLEPPHVLVDLPGGVVYTALTNEKNDVFGIYNKRGEFLRLFDHDTLKPVSINMERSFQALQEAKKIKNPVERMRRVRELTPLKELKKSDIEYLENRFGPTFGKYPPNIHIGLYFPELQIPSNYVVLWNEKKREYEEVPPHVFYKTVSNRHEEVFGIYKDGQFQRFFNIHTHKPAALNMEYVEDDAGKRHVRDVKSDEIEFLRTKFGGH